MSFYPPGWEDRERLLNVTGEELMALSDEQRTALFDGLRATLGEDGFKETLAEMDRRQEARLEAAKSEERKQQERLLRAPYIQNLDLVFRFQGGAWQEWGFHVFRTPPYGPEHDARWAEFRRRWDEIIEEQLAPHRGSLPQVDRAIELLKFQWVEDPALEGASAADVAG